jgi:uncharacterized membrane protein (DUF485 family)
MRERERQESRAATTVSPLGLWLCAAYMLLYAGFIALVLARPDLLAATALGGVNLAILCGLGLIAAALVLSVAYMAARSR